MTARGMLFDAVSVCLGLYPAC